MRRTRHRQVRQSHAAAATSETRQPDWRALLAEAIDKPGVLSDAYSQFHAYSFGNLLLAWCACAKRNLPLGPISTFAGWKKVGRHVRRGEQAIELVMPVTVKVRGEAKQPERGVDGTQSEVGTRQIFVLRPHWFVLAQTDGPEVPALECPSWSASRALAALSVTEVPFRGIDGNCQGYARGREIAVSPIARHPHRTRMHELAHVVLGHTADESHEDGEEPLPRRAKEIEAELTTYLCLAALHLDGAEASRGYLQHWIDADAGDHVVDDRSLRRVLHAADTILRAGRGESLKPRACDDGA